MRTGPTGPPGGRPVIDIDFCPLILRAESLKMHWSTTASPNQSNNHPECLRSLYSIKIPCIKQKFQYKTALFINVKSFISARARRILSYRIAIWLRAAPCWASPVTPPTKPLPQPLGHLQGLTETQGYALRRLKLHGQNHTKCTQFGPCKKIVFHGLCFLKTEY